MAKFKIHPVNVLKAPVISGTYRPFAKENRVLYINMPKQGTTLLATR